MGQERIRRTKVRPGRGARDEPTDLVDLQTKLREEEKQAETQVLDQPVDPHLTLDRRPQDEDDLAILRSDASDEIKEEAYFRLITRHLPNRFSLYEYSAEKAKYFCSLIASGYKLEPEQLGPAKIADDALDLLAKKASSLRSARGLFAWVRSAVYFLTLRAATKRKREAALGSYVPGASNLAGLNLESSETSLRRCRQILKAVHRLPLAERNAMLLRLSGHSDAEIAEALEIKGAAVRTRLSRARSKLAIALAKHKWVKLSDR